MEFPATLEYLSEMMDHIKAEAHSHGVDEKAILKLQLACEEAIVNIISYAYPNGHREGAKLMITCEKTSCRFIITLKDQGVPFNPIDFEVNPQKDKPTQDRKIGGLGIFLIRKMIDEVYYQRVDDENILKLTFSCES